MRNLDNGYWYDPKTQKLYRLVEIKPSTSFTKTKYRIQTKDNKILYKSPEQIEAMLERRDKNVQANSL
ncbi:MAG: hypothetical protein IKB64_09795 [Paludibacteraceae bacterium]|nr:hypothetical protein [Paludibacteraceae bacterium]